MNTDQLLYLMRCAVSNTRVKSVHVVPRDALPSITFESSLPAAIGFNEQNSSETGTHWLFLWVDRDRSGGQIYGTFIDSYGRNYIDYKFPKLNFPIITANFSNLQMLDSSVCGYYVVYMTYYFARNYRPEEILKRFTAFPSRFNDNEVVKFVKKFRMRCQLDNRHLVDCNHQSSCSRLHRL